MYKCPLQSKSLFFVWKIRPAVSQGYHEGTHEKSLSHALDFAVSEGTAVFASRSGVVADCASHFTEGGKDEGLRHKANYICIRHDEGHRYSRYYHLKQVLVSIGQVVQENQLIGYSGNTGYSMGPHLHFDVVDLLGVEITTLRLRMQDRNDWQDIRCIPLSFSKFPFPSEPLILPLHVAPVFDLSTDSIPSFIDGDFALLCERGGESSFLEKAQRALKMGAKCLIIVDNDESMKETMPFLIGDHSPMLDLFVLFIAYANRDWINTAKIEDARCLDAMLPPCMEISLRKCPYYSHNQENCEVAFHKPQTFPIRLLY